MMECSFKLNSGITSFEQTRGKSSLIRKQNSRSLVLRLGMIQREGMELGNVKIEYRGQSMHIVYRLGF